MSNWMAFTRKRVSVVASAALLLGLIPPMGSPTAKADEPAPSAYVQDFESTAVGQAPAEWTASAAGSGDSVAVSEDASGNHRLTFKKKGNGTGESAYTTFAAPLQGAVSVDLRVMAQQTGQSDDFLVLKDSGGHQLVSLIFDQDYDSTGRHSIASRTAGGGSWTTLQPYTANQWYAVHVDVDLDEDTFDVAIDGASVASGLPLMTPADDIAQLGSSIYSWTNGTFHLDDVQVAQAGAVVNQAPQAADVSIAGTAEVGETLTGAYTYSDAEGDAEGSSLLQWYGGAAADGSDKAPIGGAASASYTVTAADAGSYLFFAVTPVAATGTPQGAMAVSAPVQVPAPPVGSLDYTQDFESTDVGQAPADWTVSDGGGSVSVTQDTYGGNRVLTMVQTANGQGDSASTTFGPITGAFTVDMRIMAEQTGQNANFLTLKNSAGTTVLELLYDLDYDNTGRHSIARRTPDGNWTGLQTYAANQWYDVHVTGKLDAGTFDVAIDGTTVASGIPFLAPSDNIAQLSMSAYRWGNGTFHADDIHVAQASPESLNVPPTAGNVGITGTPAEGQTLTGSYAYSDADGDAEGASLFQWYVGETADGSDKTPIDGATAISYTPTADDAGQYLFFEVTPMAASGKAQGDPAVSAPALVLAASDLYFAEDFESTALGGLPEGWSSSPDSDKVAVTQLANGTHDLTLSESANGTTTSTAVDLTPITQSVTIQMRIMAEQTGSSANFLTLKDSGGTKIFELLYDQDYDHSGRRHLSLRSVDGNWSDLQQYNANQWYDVQVDVNMADRTASVSIDGALVRSGIPLLAAASDIAQFSMSAYRYQQGKYHLDDLRIVKPANQPPIAKYVSISGTPAVGQTLTGNYTYSDAEGDAEGATTFQWYRGTKADGSDKAAISGATTQQYTLTAVDQDRYIFFSVRPAALTGGRTGLLVVGTPIVAQPPLAPDAEALLGIDELPTEIGMGKFSPVSYAPDGVQLDGDFDKWRAYTGVKLGAPGADTDASWGGPADLSAEAYYAYDADNFYLAVKATDDVHDAIPGGSNWQGDGVQFAFGEPAFASFHTEYGVSCDGTTPDVSRYNDGMAVLGPDAVQLKCTTSGNDTIYELAIPWQAVVSVAPAAGGSIPFTFLVNDNDGSGRKGYVQWTGGIGASKDVSLFAGLQLMNQGEAWSSWLLGSNQVDSGETPQFTLYIPNFSDSPLDLQLDIPAYDVSGEDVAIPAGQLFKKTFSATIDTAQTITATITEPSTGKTRTESLHVDVTMSSSEISSQLDDLENTVLPRLRNKLAEAAAQGISTDYETVNASVIADFIPYGRADLANGRASRAQYMADTMYTLDDEAEQKLDAYMAGSATPPSVPRYVTGETTIDGYSVLGDTTEGTDRPIFFTGYGMFGQVVKDIPKFADLGTNLVDYNFYPSATIVQDSGPDGFKASTSQVQSVLVPMLADAEQHNIGVNIDLATHGLPSWVYDASHWPDLYNGDSLYSQKWDFENPKLWDLLKAHIDAVIPLIKDSPALKSVTLTSEPNYYKNGGAYHLNDWHAYLADHYDTVDDMNSLYGTSYASFDEVPAPNVDNYTGSPLYYDYLTFKTQMFTEFQQKLADEVHRLAPDLPVHIKIMGYGATHRDPMMEWGIDPEAYSAMTDFSGDDNGILEEAGPQGYLDALSLYDLQSSFQEKPVFNSEDHVITDGDERYTPEIAKSVENGLWAGAFHGRTLSAIWVWERSYDTQGAAYLQGSILNRPDAAAAVGRVNLDLNRLADQVTAFQNAPAKVALLYSFTSNLYSSDYYGTLKKAYDAMSYTGQKVGYVTENQINDPAGSKLDDFDLLVLPETTNLSADTLANIRSWVEAGGHVVTIGDPAALLTGDEHDLPLSAADRDAVLSSPNTVQAASNPTEAALKDVFFEELDQLDLDNVIVYDAATNEPLDQAEWRTASYNGETLLSLINYSETDKTVYVEVGGARVTPSQELVGGTDNASETLALPGLGHSLYVLPSDAAPPTTEASLSQQPNAAGWNNGDVTVTLQAADNEGGTGVAGLTYSADGAQPIEETAVDGPSADVVITAEGATTLSFYATDAAGNAEAVQQLEIRIDKTAPTVTFSGDGEYTIDQHVTISCQAADGSGVADDPCASPLVDSPAYRLGLGQHQLTVQAADQAGNSVTQTADYKVKVTLQSLINLLRDWLTGPGAQGRLLSLIVKLQHHSYDAFIHELSGSSDKSLTDEQRQSLQDWIQALRS